MKRARHWITVLGPEPWAAHDQDPSDRFCCSGYECGCGGLTVREHWESGRKDLPPIEWIRIEKRTVEYGQWAHVSKQQVIPEGEAQAYIDAHPERYPFLNNQSEN